MKSYEEMKDDSFNTLRKVLDGSYTVGQQLLTLTVNNVVTEFSFSAK